MIRAGCVIFSGGTIDLPFARRVLAEQTDERTILIAADRGLRAMDALGVRPDWLVGDFDSVGDGFSAKVEALRSDPDCHVVTLVPEKDDTDTEHAVDIALSETAGDIVILGGTGTRMDHVLGNLCICGKGKESGRRIYLEDPHNRIFLLFSDTVLRRREAFGRYVSLIPFGEEVTGLTLTGFKYPLSGARLSGFSSQGISNELTAEEGHISFSCGTLICVESCDG